MIDQDCSRGLFSVISTHDAAEVRVRIRNRSGITLDVWFGELNGMSFPALVYEGMTRDFPAWYGIAPGITSGYLYVRVRPWCRGDKLPARIADVIEIDRLDWYESPGLPE